MFDSPLARFLAPVVVGAFAAFAVASVVAPPDPFSPLVAGPLVAGPLVAGPLVAGPLVAVLVPVAYYLAYRGGWDAVAARLGR